MSLLAESTSVPGMTVRVYMKWWHSEGRDLPGLCPPGGRISQGFQGKSFGDLILLFRRALAASVALIYEDMQIGLDAEDGLQTPTTRHRTRKTGKAAQDICFVRRPVPALKCPPVSCHANAGSFCLDKTHSARRQLHC